ncbi:MAG TPA: formate dehydrogenase accessory sulfurtransferase FdhD [Firmicutes bacterium]|nr:formate dehydrogenase accessory sulfurtransferase FdhD [Bacillota bacterium]
MRELPPSGAARLTPVTIRRWEVPRGEWREAVADVVAEEYPLSVRCQGQQVATLMCSPEYLDELALGFLYSEGLIISARDVVEVRVEMQPERGEAYVTLGTDAAARLPSADLSAARAVFTGCGQGSPLAGDRPVPGGPRVAVAEIRDMMKVVMQAPLHRASGGTHAAALAKRGSILCLREDVGRHNAVDKTTGWWLRQGGTGGGELLVLTTGRLSSDMVLKAIRLGAPVLVSRAAPTAQGIRLAFRAGLTLVGFARAGRMNVYTCPERVVGG